MLESFQQKYKPAPSLPQTKQKRGTPFRGSYKGSLCKRSERTQKKFELEV